MSGMRRCSTVKIKRKKVCNPIFYGVTSAVLAAAMVGNTAIAQSDAAVGEAAELEEIVVRGIRKSLNDALDTKRDASSIVDAISSEEIGKFPDKNVADSLQRVPGVSVDRIWGEGRDIFVRGTDSNLNRTLMNNQNVASAFWWANDNASRGFNYDILASELVSSLEVYKSAEADIDEGSIGGLVNVRTRRPLDMDSLTIRGSLEAQHSSLPDETDPQYSALLSWKNEDETFGVLVSTNHQERTVRRDGLEAFPTNALYDVTDQNGNVTRDVYAVWGGGSAIFSQDRVRDTHNITLQFRPSDSLDMALNYVNSDMDMDNSNQNYLFVVGGFKLEGGDRVSNPRFIPTSDGRQALVGGTLENPNSVGVADEPIVREAFVESEVLDFDLNYEGETWRAHAQIGTTEASGGSTKDRNYWFTGNTRSTINLGPRTNEFGFLDVDPLDGNAIRLNAGALRDWVRIMNDEEDYVQGDLEFDLDWGLINQIKVGVKRRDHTIINNRSVGGVDVSNSLIAGQVAALNSITLADVSNGPTPSLHGETASGGSLTQYAFLDIDTAIQRVDSILDSGAMTYREDTQAFFNLNEEITAAYVKVNFEHDRFRGNFGLRAVDTDQASQAYIDGVLGTVNRSYSEVLPSFNLIYDLSDNMILRAAASKAMARPTYTNLSSNIVINATSGVATAGNPHLEPTFSDQFELGVEWYIDDDSLLAATVFSKSLDTFVFNRSSNEIINGQSLNVTRPFNAEDGADIKGLEVQYQQFFGENFGVTANITLTDADVPPVPGGPKLELPGNSDTQGNFSVFYENDVFSARLSYNFRSEAFGGLTSGSQVVTDKYDQWDFNATWTINDTIDLFVSGVNIFNEVIYQRTSDGIPIGFYENGPRYSLGARFSF